MKNKKKIKEKRRKKERKVKKEKFKGEKFERINHNNLQILASIQSQINIRINWDKHLISSLPTEFPVLI